MKKRLTCLLLALVLMLSILPLGAAAAEETSPTEETEAATCYHLNSAFTEMVLSTCTQKGTTASLVCKDCGTVLIPGIALPLGDHSYIDGACTECGTLESENPEEPVCYHLDTSIQNTAESTCTGNGYTGDFVCDACGKVLVSGIQLPKKDHSYEEGICTVCGETDPDAAQPEETEPEETQPEENRCYHFGSKLENTVQRTCTQDGYTGDLTCQDCGTVLLSGFTLPAEGHSYDAGICSECGEADPDYVEPSVVRLSGSNRCATALKAADALKRVLGKPKFDVIVYTSGRNFADALAGSSLAAQKQAPILLYLEGSAATNLDYIRENLAEDGTVYILGGETAVPAVAEAAIQVLGIRTQRLSGPSRYDTNLAILEECGFSGGEVLVCSGDNFADSLSASATGLPILLVDEDWTELNEQQKAYLEDHKGHYQFTILGGTAAVSRELEASLKSSGSVRRLAGQTRYETSTLVAEEFFHEPERAVVAYAKNFPDGLCGGPLAYFSGAPLLLTTDSKSELTAGYTTANSITAGFVLGGEKLISDASAHLIFGQ